MSKKLNEIVEKSLLFSKFFKDKNIDEDIEIKTIFELAKSQTINEIYEEVKNEIKQKAIDEVQEEIENQKLIHKIKELKTLTIVGVIIAFFIGMSVNQVTGFLALFQIFKEWYGMIIIFIISILIVMSIITCWIFKEERK